MRIFAWVPAVAICIGGIFATSGDALASCADVNAGAFDRTAYTPPGSGVLNGSTFDVGDELTFTVSGLTGSSFQLINGALNTALLTQPLSGAPATLNYMVTGTNSDTTLYTYMLVQAIPFQITISATCVAAAPPTPPAPPPAEPPPRTANESQAAIGSFLSSRIAGIVTDPSHASLQNRGSGAQATGGDGSDPLGSFAALGYAVATTGSGSSPFPLSVSQVHVNGPWGIWIEGRFSTFAGSADRVGQLGVVHAGGDYRLTDDLLIGVMAQFDWTQESSVALGSRTKGFGWMLGPYLSAELLENIYLDLHAAWGRSSNELALGGATGAFDTERWLVNGRLSGNWQAGALRVTPGIDFAYSSDRASAFTDSMGLFVPGKDASFGRLQFGAEFGYRLADIESAFVEPFVGVNSVWTSSSASSAGNGPSWRLHGGLKLENEEGLSVRGTASWDGLGSSGYRGYTVQGSIHAALP